MRCAPPDELDRAAPSIAVLPFENLSQDVEQQHFADGLAEDIITRISRLRWLFVSARNSSFTFRSKALDIREIGQALGVRYVLNGSVRRSEQRLRIGAQLSDTSTGGQVWAERYDVELVDFFALQDQIASSVTAAIEARLFAAEQQRFQSRRPDSLDAWGFVMKAMPFVWSWRSARGNRDGAGSAGPGARGRAGLSTRQQPPGLDSGHRRPSGMGGSARQRFQRPALSRSGPFSQTRTILGRILRPATCT